MELQKSYLKKKDCVIKGKVPKKTHESKSPRSEPSSPMMERKTSSPKDIKNILIKSFINNESKDILVPEIVNVQPEIPKEVQEFKCQFMILKTGKICGMKLKDGKCRYRHPQPANIEIEQDINKDDKCPCIIQSGINKGKKCGNPIKENGKCARHQKTCIGEEGQQILEEKEEIKEIALNEFDVQQDKKCPCIIQSGPLKGRICGKPIKEAGKCMKHQRKCESKKGSPVKIIQETIEIKIDEECPCIIKNGPKRGQLCGKPIKENGKCRYHQNTCERPEETVQTIQTVQPVPIVEQVIQEQILEPIQEPQQDDIEEPDEPAPEDVWQVVNVSEEELHSILDNIQIRNIDMEQLERVNEAVLSCF